MIDRGRPSLLDADIGFDVSGRFYWLQRMARGTPALDLRGLGYMRAHRLSAISNDSRSYSVNKR
jgi:hypothetical protein